MKTKSETKDQGKGGRIGFVSVGKKTGGTKSETKDASAPALFLGYALSCCGVSCMIREIYITNKKVAETEQDDIRRVQLV